MHKVNFLAIYDHDSATEELRSLLSKQYKDAAEAALERSGRVLAGMKENNSEIDIPWHFRKTHRTHSA